MKKLILLLVLIPFIYGCAAGSATAGYSVRAGSADDLRSTARIAIIDEAVKKAVDEAFTKCKDYIDNNFVKKKQ